MPDMTLTIRPYEDADEAVVADLWHTCNLVVPWNDPVSDIRAKLDVQREMFLVGTVDERVVASAMAGYDGHRGWVYYLAVHPDWSGRGFGQRLMERVETLLRAAGCPKINLQVRESNVDVIAFYERLGYTRDRVVSYGKRLDGR